jgi:hypothetical protein|tara:strand:- start:66 stop:770 length:705 start_codon:yes stop_codon:yes gene_type:complete
MNKDQYEYLSTDDLEAGKIYRARKLEAYVAVDNDTMRDYGFKSILEDREETIYDLYGYIKVVSWVDETDDYDLLIKPLNISTLLESGTLQKTKKGGLGTNKANLKKIEDVIISPEDLERDEWVEIDFKSALQEIGKQMVSNFTDGTELNFKRTGYMIKLNTDNNTYYGNEEDPINNYLEWKKNELDLIQQENISDTYGDDGLMRMILEDEVGIEGVEVPWDDYIVNNYSKIKNL